MLVHRFSVSGQSITRVSQGQIVSDSKHFIGFHFTFSAEWDGVAKTAVITTGGTTYNCLIGADGTVAPANMPVLRSGACTVSVFGGDLYTANECAFMVGASGLKNGTTPPAPPHDIYNQILTKATSAENHAATAENLANDSQNKAATEAKKAEDGAVAAAGSAKSAADAVAGFDTHAAAKTKLVTDEGTRQVGLVAAEGATQTAAAKAEADKSAGSAVAAKASETQADASEAEALLSQQKAQQALADLLKIIGVDIATLVGGKIPMSQIPATATQEIYTVTSEAELVGLTAQRGDLAELITVVNGVRTITKTWQLLGMSTVASDWVLWGTAYAVSAGNASTATNADNAAMINNHRMVEMKQADFDKAVKDPATYYLVTA